MFCSVLLAKIRRPNPRFAATQARPAGGGARAEGGQPGAGAMGAGEVDGRGRARTRLNHDIFSELVLLFFFRGFTEVAGE